MATGRRQGAARMEGSHNVKDSLCARHVGRPAEVRKSLSTIHRIACSHEPCRALCVRL
jgi:hypothetical protein